MLDFGGDKQGRGWVWQLSSMHCDSIHDPYWANCQGQKFHQFTGFPGNLWLGVERWKPHLWECCFNIVQGPKCKFHLIISLKILLVTFSFLSASLAIIGQLNNDFIQHLSFSISWSILPSIPPEGFVRIYVASSWYFVTIPIRQAGMEPCWVSTSWNNPSSSQLSISSLECIILCNHQVKLMTHKNHCSQDSQVIPSGVEKNPLLASRLYSSTASSLARIRPAGSGGR